MEALNQNQNPIPPHPASPAGKRHIPLWLALGIIILAAIGVGYWAWRASNQGVPFARDVGGCTHDVVVKVRNSNGEEKFVPANCIPEGWTQDQLADWQTYRNEEYGFEIEYDAEYTVNNSFRPLGDGEKIHLSFFDERVVPNQLGNEIQVFETYDSVNLTAWLVAENYEIDTFEPTEIGGQTGMIAKGKDELGLPFVHAAIKNNNYLYVISLGTWDAGNDDYVNKVLSSFRFISDNSVAPTEPLDTTGWKTYRNVVTGYEFKYPPSFKVVSDVRDENSTNNNEGVALFTPENESLRIEVNNQYYGYPKSFPNSTLQQAGIVTIAGETAIRHVLGDKFNDGILTVIAELTKGQPHNDSYAIVYTINGLNTQTAVKKFGELVSTFKFVTPFDTDYLAEYEGWKTYRDYEYGFEIKYPPDMDVQKGNFDLGSGILRRMFTFRKPGTNETLSVLPSGTPSEGGSPGKPFSTSTEETRYAGSLFVREWKYTTSIPNEVRYRYVYNFMNPRFFKYFPEDEIEVPDPSKCTVDLLICPNIEINATDASLFTFLHMLSSFRFYN